MYNRRTLRISGYTLLEMGIVLLILSLLTSAALTVINQNTRIQKQALLKQRMDRIEEAVLAYRRTNGYIPCPGSLTVNEESSQFGWQAANAGSCRTGTPAATWNDLSAGAYYNVGGAVPIYTLGLSTEYAYDPWGGRFLYFVDQRATKAINFNSLAVGTTTGTMLVKDSGGTNITSSAVLVIASMGPNGHGAYVSSGTRKASLGNAHEDANSKVASTPPTLASQTTFYAHRFSITSADMEEVFDDTVRFYTINNLVNAGDIVSERP